ncbi:MAG: hypothetical protein ABFD69_10080 [Candidatus Sumerlaeia bacterium]
MGTFDQTFLSRQLDLVLILRGVPWFAAAVDEKHLPLLIAALRRETLNPAPDNARNPNHKPASIRIPKFSRTNK